MTVSMGRLRLIDSTAAKVKTLSRAGSTQTFYVVGWATM